MSDDTEGRGGIVQASDAAPVVVDGVVKRYGRRTVLDAVSLAVPPGITGLVGPNGAGKSTLVRAILGLVRLAAGSVRVFGLDPVADPRQVRQLVGVVPEDECTVPGLAAVEMVRYAARLSGLPSIEALRRAHEVLDWCDAGQERYRPVETLSVGMRQKVAFAAAIVHDPQLVILDEPTNGLDPLERRAMLGRLETLAHRHGKTVFLSTHVLPDVEAICDHVIVLAGGRVRLAGSIESLTRPAAAEMRLEGTGPLDELATRLRQAGLAARVADPRGIVFPTPDAVGTALVWRTAKAAGVDVSSLAGTHRPLEDVFMQAIAATEETGHAVA